MPGLRPASLIGAPTDVGAGVRGAGLGPEALRLAGIAGAIGRDGRDCGNLAGPANPGLPPVDGHRHLPQVAAWNRAVHDAVHGELAGGRLPILLGGDHCLAIGSISAVARHCRARGLQLRVLWLDAHADFNTAALSPTGNLHGMPAACLCGFGPAELVGLGGRGPALAPAEIRQLGVRSVDPGEKGLLREAGVQVFAMAHIDAVGMGRTLEEALAGVDESTHLHLSFDLDFLDPDIAPGVGTPVPGGPTYREARLCMERVADTGRLGSLDLVELNPALDHRNRTAELAVDLVARLFETDPRLGP